MCLSKETPCGAEIAQAVNLGVVQYKFTCSGLLAGMSPALHPGRENSTWRLVSRAALQPRGHCFIPVRAAVAGVSRERGAWTALTVPWSFPGY